MIKYDLACSHGHGFEAWFRSIDAYERQAKRNLVACPHCGCNATEKQPMAPAVVTSRSRPSPIAIETANPAAATAADAPAAHGPPIEMLRAFRRHVLENSEDVGPRFAEEALKIHHGEAGERAIRGQATREEAAELHDEGVGFGILPLLPEDQN